MVLIKALVKKHHGFLAFILVIGIIFMQQAQKWELDQLNPFKFSKINFMKQSQIILIVIGFILVTLMVTNPSTVDHKEAIKK